VGLIQCQFPPDDSAIRWRLYFGITAGAEDAYVEFTESEVAATAGRLVTFDASKEQAGFPPTIGSVNTVEYLPWLLQAGPFHQSRSMQSDIGQFTIQNISGDTISRDMSKIVTARAFEGAIFAYREFNRDSWDVEFEFHGRLSIVGITEQLASFSAEQLWNPSSYEVGDAFSETCRWEQYTAPCGAATSQPVCNNTFFTCVIKERFGGVLNTFIAQNALTSITPTVADVSTRQQYRGRKF
jgi:hypothetical protein